MNPRRRAVLIAATAAALACLLPATAATEAAAVTRRFLGATGQRAFHLTGLQPEQGEVTARFEVRAAGELYTSSDPATVTHTW
ncbi:hypothetical protein ABZ642_08995 [Streptomyces sp. NPDC007157]|uniref:hypothetical protein n=1 Tax=Streptomyces sp. NPDC007157 TaxID=3154681 RepID=UPI00340664B9